MHCVSQRGNFQHTLPTYDTQHPVVSRPHFSTHAFLDLRKAPPMFRLQLVRRTHPSLPRRSLSALAVTAALVALALPMPAIADTSTGQVQVFVTIAIRSLTVSTGLIDFTSCHDQNGVSVPGLVIPGGNCATAPIAITNGAVPSKIIVQPSKFHPSDNFLGSWDVVKTPLQGTSNKVNLLSVLFIQESFMADETPVCESAFGPSCGTVGAGVSKSPHLYLNAPNSSSFSAPGVGDHGYLDCCPLIPRNSFRKAADENRFEHG